MEKVRRCAICNSSKTRITRAEKVDDFIHLHVKCEICDRHFKLKVKRKNGSNATSANVS